MYYSWDSKTRHPAKIMHFLKRDVAGPMAQTVLTYIRPMLGQMGWSNSYDWLDGRSIDLNGPIGCHIHFLFLRQRKKVRSGKVGGDEITYLWGWGCRVVFNYNGSDAPGHSVIFASLLTWSSLVPSCHVVSLLATFTQLFQPLYWHHFLHWLRHVL